MGVTILLFFVSFGLFAQTPKISLDFRRTKLETVLKSIEQQVGKSFFYEGDLIKDLNAPVTIRVKGVDLEEAIDLLFNKQLQVQQTSQHLVLQLKQASSNAATADSRSSSSTPLPAASNSDQAAVQTKEFKVSGTVFDQDGLPIPGAAVVVKGNTKKFAIADANGKFEITDVSPTAILVISCVGYETLETPVNSRSAITINMEQAVNLLQDVLVTGYQAISRERATGAYSIITSEKLEQKSAFKISDIMYGLVPGLAISSAPVDGSTRFIIRGVGTMSGARDPLIVVDGFPIYGSGGVGADDVIKDPFATINPNDVETITILKDAAATSIYGAQAANGVIVITTKKGKSGRFSIAADAFVSVGSRVDLDYLYNMAPAESQFRLVELLHKYRTISLTQNNDPYLTPTARITYMSEPYALLWERDGTANITEAVYNNEKQRLLGIASQELWKDDLNKYVYRNALHRQYNLSLRGATDILTYSFSASYDYEDQFLKGNTNKRILINMASSAKLTKHLTFDVALNTVFAKRENNGIAIVNLTPWSRVVDDNDEFVHWPTTSTVYYPVLMSEYDGKTPASWRYNPVADQPYQDRYANNMNYRIQGGFEYQTSWGLKLAAKGQYERRIFNSRTSYDPESFFVRNYYNVYATLNAQTGTYTTYFPLGGIFTESGDKYDGYNLRGQADFNRQFGKHALTLLAGSEILSSSSVLVPSITRYGYNKYTNSVIATPDYVTRTSNIFGASVLMPYTALGTLRSYEERFFSAYANAAYTYDGKATVSGSFRTDASNYQGLEVRKKFSPFWSVGGSWLLSKEHFIQDISWIDVLKLRITYGLAGVAAGKSGTSSITTVSTFPGNVTFTNNEPFNTISARGNPGLTWEKSRTLNFGIDAAFFGNKLFGSIEWYRKNSYDVLSYSTVPVMSLGVTSAIYNNAKLLNRGLELSLGVNLQIIGDLRWMGSLNYDYNHNEVTGYYLTTSFLLSNPGYVVGYPMNMILVLNPVGYTPEGLVILEGKDGTRDVVVDLITSHTQDPIVRQGDAIKEDNWINYLGTSIPKSNVGFSNQFSWKGLTLSCMITGRFGYYSVRDDLVNGTNLNLSSYSKKVDHAFQVYDEGYQNQTSFTALPLYNDENWTVFRTSNYYTYTHNVFENSKIYYVKGDHLRLKEVYLGYDLPEQLLAKQGLLSRVNIYAQASNLGIIWSANKEMDPDYPIRNIKPIPTFTFGVRLNFK